MRIAIIATGSRGDVEPYLALAQGLKKAGHMVRLVTHTDFERMVTELGIEFWAVAGSVQEVAQSAAMSDAIGGGNFLKVMRLMAKEAESGALALAKGGLAACQGMDLILAGIGGVFVGTGIAEKLNLPLLQAYYIPFTPTRAYPSFLFPNPPSWLNGPLNKMSYSIAQQVMWQGFRSADRKARRQVLDMPATSFWGPFDSQCMQDTPILYGYSPAVIPPAPDWNERTHVTGYWFLEPDSEWTPPTALLDFLQSGPPPIYVGFGSMSSKNPKETADLVLKALIQSKQRGVMLAGWGGLAPADLPPSVFMLDGAPFSWLFPRMAAVVHHGGAGTTSMGLRAGVPSIVVPFFGDQPYWGQRVRDLRVGPAPIPRQKLTAEKLAQAIETAVTDTAMRQRAADLGAKIQAEDGVGAAVSAVEEYAKLSERMD